MEKWSRRRFLSTGVVGSFAIGSVAVAPLPVVSTDRDLLRLAMDEIIPATDDMPSASEVGVVGYLEQLMRRDRQIDGRLRRSLAALDDLSQQRFAAAFVSLPHDRRVQALTAFEQQQADHFKTLRDFVYEGYYVRPEVEEKLLYTPYPTDSLGPDLTPFDETILAVVRKKATYYREA